MSKRKEPQGILVPVVVCVLALAGAIIVGGYVHRRAPTILERLVATDPAPPRRALRLRLEADRLVREALARHEAATSGSVAGDALTSGPLVSDAVPLLREAERLYLESLDAATSQPGLLFQLGEVNLLLGRRARGFLFMARYWEAMGESALARAYRERAKAIDPTLSIATPADRATSGSVNQASRNF